MGRANQREAVPRNAVPPVLERLTGRHPPSPVPLALSSPDLPPQLCTLVDRCLALAPEACPTTDVLAIALETP